MELIIFIILLIGTYFTGTVICEKKHYRSILKREKEFLNLPAVTAEDTFEEGKEIAGSRLVSGSVVVSIDYFKQFLGGLRNIFGGEVGSYGSVIDRARREALLRMKAEAGDADIIVNTRVETANIGSSSAQRNQSLGCSEVLAYGTAVTYKK